MKFVLRHNLSSAFCGSIIDFFEKGPYVYNILPVLALYKTGNMLYILSQRNRLLTNI